MRCASAGTSLAGLPDKELQALEQELELDRLLNAQLSLRKAGRVAALAKSLKRAVLTVAPVTQKLVDREASMRPGVTDGNVGVSTRLLC